MVSMRKNKNGANFKSLYTANTVAALYSAQLGDSNELRLAAIGRYGDTPPYRYLHIKQINYVSFIFLITSPSALTLSPPGPKEKRVTHAQRGRWGVTAGQGSKRLALVHQAIEYACEARSKDQGRILRIKNFDPGRKRFHCGTVSDYPLQG